MGPLANLGEDEKPAAASPPGEHSGGRKSEEEELAEGQLFTCRPWILPTRSDKEEGVSQVFRWPRGGFKKGLLKNEWNASLLPHCLYRSLAPSLARS